MRQRDEQQVQANARKPHRDKTQAELLSPENPGEQFFTPDEWRRIGAALGLSRRELQVAALLFEGQNCAGIAYRLRRPDGRPLSPHTVRVYLDRLRRKTQALDTTSVVLRIVRIHQALSAQEG
jgi:DNA-binding NarL/FixJ family response regulator